MGQNLPLYIFVCLFFGQCTIVQNDTSYSHNNRWRVRLWVQNPLSMCVILTNNFLFFFGGGGGVGVPYRLTHCS